MPYDFSKLKILVIEEAQPMSEILSTILENFGVNDVQFARTSDSGFEKFKEGNHDILLIDWLIKPQSGVDLTEKIRTSKESPNKFVPIILMTGFTEKRRVIKARDKGITEFLAKPFSANDLYKRIDQIISKPRQFVKSDNFFGPDRRRKILDDDAIPKRREDDKS